MQPAGDPPVERALSRQYAKLPRGAIAAAIRDGLPTRCLRTLARITMHTSGNADGQKIRTATIAGHVGVSRRTVQRDVRHLEKHVRGLRVKRDRPKGERRRSYPNEYSYTQVGREEPGTMIFAELVKLPAWFEASATQQGVLVYLLEVLGPTGHVFTYGELAAGSGCSPSCVRQAVYYWRKAGVLEVEAQTDPEVGQIGNWMRVRSPGDVRRRTDPPTNEQRRAQALAPVTRWSGLRVAELALDDPSTRWWVRVGEAVELHDSGAAELVEGMLTQYLNGPARELGYKGSGRTRDVRAVLPYVWERRDGFDREIAERRAGDAPPVTADGRTWGEPWAGDWTPPASLTLPDVEAYDLASWPATLTTAHEAAIAEDRELVDLDGYWRGRLVPAGVVDGALVVVVPDPCAGDSFAGEYLRFLAAAVGGRVALRLASYQAQLDAEQAHRRLSGEWRERMVLVERRAAAVVAGVDAIPELPRVSVGSPAWKATQERVLEAMSARQHARDAKNVAAAVLAELDRAWTAPPAEDAWRAPRPPDWLRLEADARSVMDHADKAEAALERLRALGPLPGAFDLRAAPPGGAGKG